LPQRVGHEEAQNGTESLTTDETWKVLPERGLQWKMGFKFVSSCFKFVAESFGRQAVADCGFDSHGSFGSAARLAGVAGVREIMSELVRFSGVFDRMESAN
jgi:hypothetical protein